MDDTYFFYRICLWFKLSHHLKRNERPYTPSHSGRGNHPPENFSQVEVSTSINTNNKRPQPSPDVAFCLYRRSGFPFRPRRRCLSRRQARGHQTIALKGRHVTATGSNLHGLLPDWDPFETSPSSSGAGRRLSFFDLTSHFYFTSMVLK